MIYFAVFVGGFFGSITRYLLSKNISKFWEKSFPLSTLIINISGSYLLAFLLTLFSIKMQIPKLLQTGITVGFIGSYTTFSTFGYETVKLAEDRELLTSLAYISFSLLTSLLMTWLGIRSAVIMK